MRKLALIIAVVIVLGAVAAYFFFRSGPIAPPINPVTGQPFGNGDNLTAPGGTTLATSSPTAVTSTGVSAPKLFELSAAPVAGAVTIVLNGEDTVRFADRATGHIYDVSLVTLAKTEIVNNTLAKIYAALWSSDGSKAIFRSLPNDSDTISNLSLSLTAPKSTSTPLYQVSAVPLGSELGELMPTSDGRLAYVSITQNSRGIDLSNIDGSKPAQLLATDFTNWRISGASKTALFITTKASAGLDGFTYLVSRTNGALTKLLGPLPGLVALPNRDLSRFVYSTSDGTNTTLQATTVKTGAAVSLAPITLAEKCVWSEKTATTLYCAAPANGVDAGEPDAWYAGETHFNDQIWRFNADSGAVTRVVDPEHDYKTIIDAENLELSSDDAYLVFTNKSDLSLWALKLD